MSEPRTRLDQAMTARSLEIRKRWVQIAKEAGITTSALSGIRRREYKPSPHTARALEDAFQWEHGSIEAILAGGEPTPRVGRHVEAQDSARVTETADAEREPTIAELRAEMARERERGDRMEQRIAELEQRERERLQEQTRDETA